MCFVLVQHMAYPVGCLFLRLSLFDIESWMYIVCSRSYLAKSKAYSVNRQ